MRDNRLALCLIVPLLLAGCADPKPPEDPAVESVRGLLRAKLAQQCLRDLPAGPVSTQYNDWDEVVQACSLEARYQANQCKDPALCLRELFPANKDTNHDR